MPKVYTHADSQQSPYSGLIAKPQRSKLWKGLRAAGCITDINRPTITTAGPASLADVSAVTPEVGLMFFDATANSIARTLQASGVANEETIILAIRTDVAYANTVVLTAAGADTIEGAATIAVTCGGVLLLQLPAGSTNWRVLNRSGSTQQAAREAIGVATWNWLDNPDGEVYQQAIAATADDVYMDDCWYALTQTGTIMPSQVANPEDGFRFALRMTQSQAVAQRMGRAQIIEGRESVKLRSKVVTVGGRFKMSAAGNLRQAILAWTGTEDAVTSDVVNNWASGVYTAGNFFNATTLTVVATNSAALAAATNATASLTGVVPAGTTNLIYVYWTEAAMNQNVTLDAWALRLVEATTLVDYVKRKSEDLLAQCQRFYQTATFLASTYAGAGTQDYYSTVNYPVPMRATPTAVKTGGVFTNSSDPGSPSITNAAFSAFIRSTAAGPIYGSYTLQLNARL